MELPLVPFLTPVHLPPLTCGTLFEPRLLTDLKRWENLKLFI